TRPSAPPRFPYTTLFRSLRSRAPSRAFRLLRSEGLLGITCPSLFPEGSPAADSAYEAACQLLDHADAEAIFRLALLVLRAASVRSEEHTSELQSRENLVC